MMPNIRTIATDGKLDYLYASCRNIMGKSYLAAIRFKTTDGGDAMSIRVADRDVRGVQFCLGRFGLRGIRVPYEDETYSPWLGESSPGWLGVVFGRDLSQLRVVADDLCIIRLEFLENWTISSKRIPVMWYGDTNPSDSLVKRMFPPPHPHGQQWQTRLQVDHQAKDFLNLHLCWWAESDWSSSLTPFPLFNESCVI